MSEVSVREVVLNGQDATGAPILAIYAKNAPVYAIYRTTDRVRIHFADDPAMARWQRTAVAPLGSARGEIAGLVDQWRRSRRFRPRAERFDKRVADALVTGLEGDVPSALVLLGESKSDIIAERTALAQFKYLAWASFAAMLIIALVVGLASRRFAQFSALSPMWHVVWLAIGSGTLGAFFSIALGLRNRTILTDLHMRANRSDAVLRIVIGAIAAALVVCLFTSGLVSSSALPREAFAPDAPQFSLMIVLVVGFAAGFSERMVPDLLSKASFGGGDSASGAASAPAAVPAAVAQASAPAAIALPPPPEAVAADEPSEPDEDDGEDYCLCDLPAEESGDLRDSELPVATGGVAGGN